MPTFLSSEASDSLWQAVNLEDAEDTATEPIEPTAAPPSMGRRNAVLAALLGGVALIGVASRTSFAQGHQALPAYTFEDGFGLARKFAGVRELQDAHTSKECWDEDFKIWSEVNRTLHEAKKHCADKDEDDTTSPKHWTCENAKQAHHEALQNHQSHGAGDCLSDFFRCDVTSSYGEMVFQERKCWHNICKPTNILKDGLQNAAVIPDCTSGAWNCSIRVQCAGHENLCEVYGSKESCPPPKQQEQHIPTKSSAWARTASHAILLSILATATGWGR